MVWSLSASIRLHPFLEEMVFLATTVLLTRRTSDGIQPRTVNHSIRQLPSQACLADKRAWQPHQLLGAQQLPTTGRAALVMLTKGRAWHGWKCQSQGQMQSSFQPLLKANYSAQFSFCWRLRALHWWQRVPHRSKREEILDLGKCKSLHTQNRILHSDAGSAFLVCWGLFAVYMRESL